MVRLESFTYVSLEALWTIFLIHSGTSAEHREIGQLYTRGVATAHQLSWKRFHKPLRAHSLDVHCIYVQHRCSVFFFPLSFYIIKAKHYNIQQLPFEKSFFAAVQMICSSVENVLATFPSSSLGQNWT